MRVFWVVRVTVFLLLLKTEFAFAVNPIDVRLDPSTGLPPMVKIIQTYTAEYTFTNNTHSPKLIHVTAVTIGSGFVFDSLCNNVTLQPKGRSGSSCTTHIEFTPIATGLAKAELTLSYDRNVIYLRPPYINNLSTVVGCGTNVYPSNTGSSVPSPTINSSQVWSFRSAPELHPMKVTVSPFDESLLASGIIFNAPYTSSSESTYGQTGSLIADNNGNLVWFRPLSSPSLMNTDFRVQTLYGSSVLTFWQGTIATPPAYTNIPTGAAESGACYYILDNSYRIIKTVSVFNDFTPDVHELLITPSNTGLFFGTKVVPMDLTPYGGPADGAIHDFSIQEVDLATGALLFFGDAKDHIPLSSSHIQASTASQTSNVWDPYHLNSLGIISGSSDILFSSRNTWTIYRLNKTTGNFVWRLTGDGVDSDFTFSSNAAKFSWQHDARYLPGDIITMFDDSCCTSYDYMPPSTIPSHGLILSLNLGTNVASLDTAYYHDPNLFSSSQGNTQSLANGNKFVGYGANGYYTKFAAAGNTVNTPAVNVLYDAQMPSTNVSYRSYRDNWVGTPYYQPSIAVVSTNQQSTIYASWNGSTETRSWQVYAGRTLSTLTLVTNQIKNGFETAITTSNNEPYFQVQAIDVNGQVIGISSAVHN